MKLEVDREWFERRSKLEGDHEIGAGGLDRPWRVDPPPHAKAMLRGMAAVPAAAGLQLLAIFVVVGFAHGWGGVAETARGAAIMLLPILALAYLFGAIPTLVGALLMRPVLRANRSAVTEYLAAGVLGGLVIEIPASLFLGPEAAVLGVFGVLPAMAGVHVYRRVLPRATA